MANVVVVGAGPVGIWSAIQLKNRNPDWHIHMYERHTEYQRSHILRLDHWSLLLYGRKSKDEREQQFYQEITGKTLGQITVQATKSLYIRTNDLEAALRRYAIDKGINIEQALINSPDEVMQKHPECKIFLAADGAHSKMRSMLLGDDALEEYPLQYIIEVKYQVKGQTQRSNNYKNNQQLRHMAFEYVGKEKNGMTPITVRFFLDEATYNALPAASFKSPLSIDSPDLPQKLKEDIHTYMNIRSEEKNYCKNSGKLTKLTLSLYSATQFAIKRDDKAWFLVGDAAMGVPYFRALNCGLILGSRLAQILSDKIIKTSLNKKIMFYNTHRPLHILTEFGIARGKNLALDSYDLIRKMITSKKEKDIVSSFEESMAFSCYEENTLIVLKEEKTAKSLKL